MIISGGLPSDSAVQKAEVYVPSTGQHCQLPDLPDKRSYHSLEKFVLCGGADTSPTSDTLTSCLTLTGDGWERTNTLLKMR